MLFRRYDVGCLMIEDNVSGYGVRRFFNMFNQGAVYIHFRVVPSCTVPGGTLGRSLQLVIRRLILTAGQDNMRPGTIFDVKPVIEGFSFFRSQKIVLSVVSSDKYGRTA